MSLTALQVRANRGGAARVGRAHCLLLALALVVVGLPAAGAGAALAAPGGPDGGQAPSDGETVRLIVEVDLGAAVPGRGGIRAMSTAERRAAVAARASEVASDVSRLGGQVTTRFDTHPYLAVTVDVADRQALAALPGVVSVAPDEVVTLQLDESLAAVGAADPVPSYLGADVTGDGFAVAIIDAGIDREHEFFADGNGGSRVVAEACFSLGAGCLDGATTGTGAGSAAPPQGDSHGTHVAGIAAGSGPVGSAPARGIAPQADIVAVQAFSKDDGGKLEAFASDLARGLEFVLEQHTAANGIEVAAVNLSLGTAATDTCNASGGWDAFSAVVDSLRAEDVLTVASAGNGGNVDQMGAPACLDNVVGVGATDAAADLAAFTDLSVDTDLVAPGVGILSAEPGGQYGLKSGTSMAAPHVAGALALLREAAPAVSWTDLLPALLASETLVDDARDGGTVTGLPLLDLPRALTALPGVPDGPDAPAAPTVVAGDAEVTVDWVEPTSDSVIERYDVISRPGGHTCRTTGSPPATSCTISGLDNGTGYTFTVIASNDAGPGPASPASLVAVPTGAPSAPTNVLASAGLNSAMVTWDAPSDDGGFPIVEYAVTSDPGGLTCTSEAPLAAPDTSCVVSGLADSTSYTFTVTASNGALRSAPSAPSPAVTPDSAPEPPTNVTVSAGAPGTAVVGWTAPSDDGGAAVTGYRVTSSPGGQACVLEGDLNEMSCLVDGLTNGTSYTFTVTATNGFGTGPASAPSEQFTPVGPPGAPSGLVGVPGDGQVVLSWSPPDSDGGASITGHVVTVDDGTTETTRDCDATTSCTVTGLLNGTEYAFTVRASNSAGDGPASAPTPDTAPATVPDPPTGVVVSGGDPGTAVVSWIAPSDDGGAFILGYSAASDPDGRTCAAEGQVLSCTVTGLTGGQDYTFTVSATNARGDSAASTPSAPFTPAAAPSGGGGGGGAVGGGGGGAAPPPPDAEDDTDVLGDEVVAAPTAPFAYDIGERCAPELLGPAFPDAAGIFTTAIRCIRSADVTQGFGDGTFRPGEDLTRGETAAFLVRALRSAGVALPAPGSAPDAYSDDDGGLFEHDLDVLATLLPSTGTTVQPSAAMTRGLMARWTSAALDAAGTTPLGDPDRDWFPDDSGHSAERWIDDVAAHGVVTGMADGTYGPVDALTRGEMAAYLARLLAVLADR